MPAFIRNSLFNDDIIVRDIVGFSTVVLKVTGQNVEKYYVLVSVMVVANAVERYSCGARPDFLKQKKGSGPGRLQVKDGLINVCLHS